MLCFSHSSLRPFQHDLTLVNSSPFCTSVSMRLICGIWILSKYSFRMSKNTQRSVPRDTNHTHLIWTHTENVSILVKYFLVYVEIRDFVLTFQFFIAHWNVFLVSGKRPQTLIFYLNSLTDRGAKWFVFFKISHFHYLYCLLIIKYLTQQTRLGS